MATRILPDLHRLVTPMLGRPYAELDCWGLTRELLRQGGFPELAEDLARVTEYVREVWYCDEVTDPLALVQPWDWYLLAHHGDPQTGAWINHIGLVVNGTHFVHTRRRLGVCLEPLQRWRFKLIQVARMRCLM